MPKDYLHSDLLKYKSNDKVFQKTYDTIDEFSKTLTKSESILVSEDDDESISNLSNANNKYFYKKVIELVNFTIQNFNKY
ncbi:MAG: hypothetical protein ABF265_07800 [Polaribacter sp.]